MGSVVRVHAIPVFLLTCILVTVHMNADYVYLKKMLWFIPKEYLEAILRGNG